jgi:hypothetical protein
MEMKNLENFKLYRGFVRDVKLPASEILTIVKESEPGRSFTGQTQENYVNPKYLAVGVVASISNVSFGGLWL